MWMQVFKKMYPMIRHLPSRRFYHFSCALSTIPRFSTIPFLENFVFNKKQFPKSFIHKTSLNVDTKGQYLIGFTCSRCNTRNFKRVSKHGYNKGVVLARCEGCDNLHLIADNLGWFTESSNEPINIEAIMLEKGEPILRELTEKDLLWIEEAEKKLQNKNVEIQHLDSKKGN